MDAVSSESSSESNCHSHSSLPPFLLYFLHIFSTFYFPLSIYFLVLLPPPWKQRLWLHLSPTPIAVTVAADEAFKMSAVTRSPVSLVFLCALLFLLSVSGWGAAKPVDGDKGNFCMLWRQSTSFKFGLFAVLRFVTISGNHCDYASTFWHLFPPTSSLLRQKFLSLSFSDLVRRQLTVIFLLRLRDMRVASDSSQNKHWTQPLCNLSVNLKREKKKFNAVSAHRLLRRPDFFFFLFFGRGDWELLDFLFSLDWRTTKIKSNIKSVKGRRGKTSDCYSNRSEEEDISDSYFTVVAQSFYSLTC